MAKKKEPTVEEKLRALYDLQLIDSRIDKIRDIRGELPLEVRDLEDEIENLKNNDMPKNEETREYNKDIPIAEYEQNEKMRSLNNNARQFQNEFTLIENYEKNNNKYLVEIHKKFTLAVACILFTLVGAPLGILVRKGGITIASALSITFFLIYYILLIWGEQLADRALLDPAIGSWMPNIVLFIVGLIILFLSDKKN